MYSLKYFFFLRIELIFSLFFRDVASSFFLFWQAELFDELKQFNKLL